MTSVLYRFWDWLIAPELRQDPDVLRQANRVAGFDLAMMFWVFVFIIVYRVLGAPLSANFVLSAGVVISGSLFAIHRGKSPEVAGNILCSAAFYTYTALAFFNGGAWSPSTAWYASMPVMSLLLCGTRSGICWTVSSIVAITGFALARAFGIECPNELTPTSLRFLEFSGLVGLVLCVYLLVCVLKGNERIARNALHEANRSLELQASIDGLTGIANRRSFDLALEQEWSRHQRISLPLSVALIDADHFKQYNDMLGHLAGDDCLKSIAAAIQAGVRRSGDLVARYGGEEFALILPNTDELGALRIAEQIQLELELLELPHPRSSVGPHITISIGATTTVPTRDACPTDMIRQADVALYQAKAGGRNRIVQLAPVPATFPDGHLIGT